jgi:hypothetical protein
VGAEAVRMREGVGWGEEREGTEVRAVGRVVTVERAGERVEKEVQGATTPIGDHPGLRHCHQGMQ